MSDVILSAQSVGRTFGAFRALYGISVDFQRGKLTSIIGPNGAGKSTVFNLLSGAFPPSEGRIVFEGRDITGTPQHKFAALGIAKSFQITNVFPQLPVHENVRVALQALASRYQIWKPRSSLPELADKADALLETVGLTVSARPARWRMANSGRWKSRWRWRPIRACCCSMSPRRGCRRKRPRR